MNTPIKSVLGYVKQPDGNYIPVFYVNTADDVYVDIEKSMTLSNMIDNGTIRNQIYNVNNDTERFALTINEVKLHDIVNVYDKGSLYEVIDITKLSSEDGYKKLIIKDSTSLPLTRISTSILDKALNDTSDDTVSQYMLQGTLYTGNDLPDQIYRYSSATIIRRYNTPSVILWGGPSGTNITAVPMITHYTTAGTWTPWAPLGMTASDRSKLDVLFTKGVTTLSANPSKVIYVDPVNGLDSNTGLTTALSMQTIKAAMAKYGGLGNLNIRLADGEYTDTSVLTFNGITRVVINGNSTDNSKVVIKFPMYTSDVPVYIDGVTVDVSTFSASSYTSSDNPYALLFRGATFSVTNSRIIGPGLGANSAIIGRNSTLGYVSACDFSGWNIAVRSETHSNVYCTRLTNSGDINITYSAVGSTIEYTEDASTPIQLVHAKNTSGIIIVDGVSTNETEIKSMIRSKNYLHNWDFTNPFITTVSSLTGVGEFLERWYSGNGGNSLSVSNAGLLFSTTTSNGMISQSLSRSLVYLLYRHLTFSIWVGDSLASTPNTRIGISIVTTNSSGTLTTVASANKTGAEITDGILSCSGLVSNDYVKLECRIFLINTNTSVTIAKAKLEVGSISTLRPTEAADKVEEALKCKDTDVNGNPLHITSILFDKGFNQSSSDPTKVIYIDPVNGSDNNDGIITTKQMRTIRAAITKYGGNGLLRLVLANGEYTDSGILYINGVSSITLQPASGTTNSVVIKFPIYFRYVPFYIEYIAFDLSQNTSATYAITARSCQFAISSCKIIGNGLNRTMTGVIGTLGATGIIYNTDISYCNIAIRSESGSTTNVSNATSANINNFGYSAYGGIISYNGNTLNATSLYERSSSGIIFANGSLLGANNTVASATF